MAWLRIQLDRPTRFYVSLTPGAGTGTVVLHGVSEPSGLVTHKGVHAGGKVPG